MARLARYLVRQLLPWLVVALGGAVLVFLATQLVRVAPLFIGAGASAGELLTALGLLLVPVVGWALTPAFAVALFAVAGRLGVDGELTAFDAAGLGRWRVALGPAAVALLLAALSAWLWLDGGPRSQRALRGLAVELAGRSLVGRLAPARFHQPLDGLTFFAEGEADGSYRGVLIEDRRERRRPVQLVAREATLRFAPGSRELVLALEDGTVFYEGTDDRPPAALGFGAAELVLPLGGEIDRRLGFLPRLMAVSTSHLGGPPPGDVEGREWRYALWRRVAGPAGFLVLALVALGLALGGSWRGRGTAMVAAGVLFLGYHLLGRLAEELMRGDRLDPAAAALGPAAITLAGGGALLVVRRLAARLAARRIVVRSRLSG
jgi:lipopolysaccharide export LptBFGC system permease protein LptF